MTTTTQHPTTSTTQPPAQLQHETTQQTTQNDTYPKQPKRSRYSFPPPPAQLYHGLGARTKTQKEVHDGNTTFVTTVKFVKYFKQNNAYNNITEAQLMKPMLTAI